MATKKYKMHPGTNGMERFHGYLKPIDGTNSIFANVRVITKIKILAR
jgi:hypothetical protein